MLGELATGAKVVAGQLASGEWIVEIQSPGMASAQMLHPARFEVYEAEDKITEASAGYKSLKKTSDGFVGQAEVRPLKGVAFSVEDRWKISGAILSLSRTVTVSGSAPGGFLSGVFVSTAQPFHLPDVSYFIPGSSYGGPEHLLENATAGMGNFRSGQIDIREDKMPIPLLGMYFRDGTSLALLNAHPRGDTTAAESQDLEGKTMIDERFQFAALGVREKTGGGLDMGFWLPGSESHMEAQS